MSAKTLAGTAVVLLPLLLGLAGCESRRVMADSEGGAPPPARVEREPDSSVVKVDRPERFSLAAAGEHDAAPELNVTGVVNPDVSRNVPVISLASGRVIEVHARLGDYVKKGQILLQVKSSDISSASADYRKAVADQELARAQLDRARNLYERGATARKDLEVAEDAEKKAGVDVQTALERLNVLGAGTNHDSGIVNIAAPVTGFITEQNVTTAGGVKTLDNSPNLFTISDLSHVWVMCDVYENDLSRVKLGEYADIRLNAYPDRTFKGRIGNIAPVLDPATRTAKVRLEVANPDSMMRVGMFVTATFHGQRAEPRAVVPASAILHLHDREWVYVPLSNGRFQRVEVASGNMLADNRQEILSGIRPGAQVVENALVLENTVEQ